MRIGIINTGGTISCIGDPLEPMSAENFSQACIQHLEPILKHQFPEAELEYLTKINEKFATATHTLDSTNLQPTDWCIMADGVLENYKDFEAFIILHGTDSMDFTGAALPFLLNNFDKDGYGTSVLSKPVIITGSQVPMFYENPAPELKSNEPVDPKNLVLRFNTDAYQNFCGAIASACTGIPEVCVYFQNYLYRSSRVLKTNASEFNAFSSPNYPPLAQFGVEMTTFGENWLPGPVKAEVSLDNETAMGYQKKALVTINKNLDKFPVMQFNAFPAHYATGSKPTSFVADMLTAVTQRNGAKGIILESYGEGNFPSGDPDDAKNGKIYQVLEKAIKDGLKVIDCTQVIAGTVNSNAYGAGSWLAKVGVLSPADMTPMAAFAKLMILMALGFKDDALNNLVQSNLTGEMTNVDCLDSRTNRVLLPGQSINAIDGSATLINDPEKGPLLIGKYTNADDVKVETELWSVPKELTDLPGFLEMQNDGNLVFYNRFNTALWDTKTAHSEGTSSKLQLLGHYAGPKSRENSLKLEVFNYKASKVAKVLYK